MTITQEMLEDFRARLAEEERSGATIEKYLRDVSAFSAWLGEGELTKTAAADWKARLCGDGYSPVSVNAMLSALNSFFRFLGREDCRVRFLKVQRRVFRDPDREMTLEEYRRLLAAARRRGDTRMYLIMETICATGIRVSELQYITLEAVKAGRAEVTMKGKIRIILIPAKLGGKLEKYAGKMQIASGGIFVTRSGKPVGRKQIWAKMKALCAAAGVAPTKVFPHNLRHLFAQTHYGKYHDIVQLADVLGHSSVETTRIYLITTGEEYAKRLECLRLVS